MNSHVCDLNHVFERPPRLNSQHASVYEFSDVDVGMPAEDFLVLARLALACRF